MLKAKSAGTLLPLLPPLRRLCAGLLTRCPRTLGATASLLLVAALLTAGLAGWLLWGSGPAQAQDGEPPVVDNLRCITETERVAFLWDPPEWSGGEAYAYDYQLSLPDGRSEGGRLIGSTLVYRPGTYPMWKTASVSVKTIYEKADGRNVSSDAAELTCYIGGTRPLAITPGNTTRAYGGTDAMSYTVSGLVDGDAASNVVSGNLGRTAGEDVGSYAINLGTLAITPDYATKYALPDSPAAAMYTITPKAAAYTGTAPTKVYDGTTALAGSLSGGFAGGDIVSGDVVTVSGGSYAFADAGTGIAVTGSSVGGADAGNYDVTFSVSGDITPLEITTISGVRVNARLADGTTDATFDTGSARAIGVLAAELADFRAGGLAVSGAFPSAAAGSYDVSATYSLQDHGVFKAGNYTLSAGAASATLHGQLQDAPAQSAVAGCQPEAGDDYDADDDGLIEVCNLAQLSAIRFDLDGDGSASSSALADAGDGYEAAFPGITANGPGCPESGCQGYELTADLNLDTNGSGGADDGDAYWNGGKGWLSIGEYAAVFDGNGHTISNLHYRSQGLSWPDLDGRRGLFLELAETGVIRNVLLKKVNVSGDGDNLGALVGENRGTISNAGASGSVSGRYKVGVLVGWSNLGTITDSYSSGVVSSTGTRAAGLVGHNYGGRVVRSWSTANVIASGGSGNSVGGLVGYNVSYGESKASIVGSYATGRVSSNGSYIGGLVGYNKADVFASYATGDVFTTGRNVGGLVGYNVGPISASFALGAVSGGGNVGGLVGLHESTRKNGHRCVGCTLPNERPGHADRSGVTASYWNTQAPGQTATQAVHLHGRYNFWPRGASRTTAELRQPMDYAGIYAHWDDLRDRSGDSYAWDFGTSLDFPVLRDTGPSVAAQRAHLPDAPVSTGPAQTPAGTRSGIDYDRDDDGLIEVYNLDQLNAMRYDWEGLGWGSWEGYYWAYPNPMTGSHMGCPQDGCLGYELMTDLDFDTNGNGRADPGDHYWNGEHRPDDSAYCIDWYKWHPRQSVRETPGACDAYWGNDGEGWRPIYWQGVFEGNGHTIRNLYINTLLPVRAGDGKHNYRGLFGNIAYSGVVRNLRLENVNVSGKNFVGALAGINHGIISNVHVTGAVSGVSNVGALVGFSDGGGYITGSSSRAGVAGRKTGGSDVGGLAGINHGVIQASYARGAVSGLANNTGGLVGSHGDGGSIQASYASGPVSTDGRYAGGLVGDNYGSVTTSYATGTATADGGDAGGIAGRHRVGTVTTAYWDTQASGHGTSPAGAGQTTAELQQPTGYAGIYAGWNLDLDGDGSGDDPWDFGTASQYPALKYGGLSPQAQRAPFTALPLDLPPVVDAAEGTPNQAPTVSGSLGDVTLASDGGTWTVSLTGLFSDADNDALTITAHALTVTAEPPPGHDGASYIDVVTVSVSGDHSSLTLTGRVVGTAMVTVTASDGRGGAVSEAFVATVSAGAPAQQDTAGDYSELIAKIKQWRDDPCCVSDPAHTDRWDRTLLTFGETVSDTTLSPMTATEAQTYADRGWERWVEVVAALRELEAASQQQQQPPQQQQANRVPTVSSAIADVSGLEVDATQEVSLSGVFSDVDGDALTITAVSSDETVATVTVASDGSKLTLAGVAEGTATITVTARDADGSRVSDTFEAPVARRYTALIAQMKQWRNDPCCASDQAHTDRWDRTLLVFGETVADTTLTPMTADEAQGYADRGWNRWALVVAALRELEAAAQQQQQQPQQQQANRPPTVSAAIADATIVNESGTRQVSLSGVFSDADNDALTITAASSDEAKATASVASDGSSLTVTAKVPGTATITVMADDGNGGTVSDTFTVRVKAAPVVASGISDISGLEEGSTRDVSLFGVFSDADGDSLTITAASSDDAKATVAADQSKLTVAGVAEGTATITVTAQDADGNRVSDAFDVSVVEAEDEVDHGEPPVVANLRCVAETERVAFLWDVPEWSGGETYAYDYELTLPGGQSESGRLIGGSLLLRPGDYQVGDETSVSVKTVYQLPDGKTMSSAEKTLTCTVAE